MVTRMKTTVEIPDALADLARSVAREHGLTLRELINVGLRLEIDRLSDKAQTKPFVMPTFSGRGLKTGISSRDLVSLAYEEQS